MATKATSVRFSESVQKLIDEEMQKRGPGSPFAPLAEEAMIVYFQMKGKTGNYAPKHLPWHDMLEHILTAGTKKQCDGIQSNLNAFVAEIKLAHLMATIGTPHKMTGHG